MSLGITPDKHDQNFLSLEDWTGWLFVGVLVYAGSFYASEFGMSHTGVVALWPAAGISLWGCWRYGFPAAIASFIGFHLYGILHIEENWNNFIPSVGNAFAAMIGAHLVRRSQTKTDRSDVGQLAYLVIIGGGTLSAISAVIGASHLAFTLSLDAWNSFILSLRWFLSDIAGVLVTAPLLFAWSDVSIKRLPDWIGLETTVAVATSVVLILATQTPTGELSASAIILLISMPAAAWVILQDNRTKALVALSIIGMVSLTLGAQSLSDNNQELLQTQLFTLIFLTGAFLLHELVRQLAVQNYTLQNHKEELELAVEKRTEELLAAKQRAEEADQAKTEFIANTSHEVRTPLNAILGMAEFLSESELNPEQKSQVSTIIASGKGLMALLNDVIDLSKVEAGQLEIDNEPTDLKQLTEELTVLWRSKAESKGLVFNTLVGELSHPAYLLDAHRLRQCLSNLLSNGVKFTKRGCVSLEIAESGQFLSIRVSDTGLGMSPDNIAKLFQPFEQLDKSITREFGGTGLGLAITKKLLELMGGTIQASSAVGEGSRFEIQLPARPCQPKHAAASHTQTAITHLQGLRVLLVEDNPVNRLVAKGHLKKLNVSLDEVDNGQACLAQLAQKAYDLVLL
ncbi:MAG: ATP-binding protein, partial [Pseudomonadota bacterium]